MLLGGWFIKGVKEGVYLVVRWGGRAGGEGHRGSGRDGRHKGRHCLGFLVLRPPSTRPCTHAPISVQHRDPTLRMRLTPTALSTHCQLRPHSQPGFTPFPTLFRSLTLQLLPDDCISVQILKGLSMTLPCRKGTGALMVPVAVCSHIVIAALHCAGGLCVQRTLAVTLKPDSTL